MINTSSKEIEEGMEKMIESSTPLPGNICKKCGGNVVKRYITKLAYTTPFCEKCGILYGCAKDVRVVRSKGLGDKLGKRVR